MPIKVNFEEFVERANKTHNGFYTYKKETYTQIKAKIEIICPKHGSFWKDAYSHYKEGYGCNKCNKQFRVDGVTFNIFEKRSKIVHNNFYKYIEEFFVDTVVKTKIICPIHGVFNQSPHNHLRGHKCRKCAKNEKKTFYEFKKISTKIHNRFYNYNSKTYTNTYTKTEIICPEHGAFWQLPNSHMNGHGCNNCDKVEFKEFEQKSKKVHNNFYTYVKETYINTTEKTEIICPVHGSFFQIPNEHMRGHRCKKCHFDNLKLPFIDFIERSNKKHGDFYTYTESTYKDTVIKTEIICPVHGPFFQTPHGHMAGHGCSKCSSPKMELEVERLLLLNTVVFEASKKYTDLRDKGLLSYDFYVPVKNVLIECNGIQHYQLVEYWGGQKGFEKQVLHDEIKFDYANKIQKVLLIIRYDQNVGEELLKAGIITRLE